MKKLFLVADNVRSIENTGALFRLADGMGIHELLLVGITPYPDLGEHDTRRPWLRQRVTQRLQKTGLSGMGTPFRYFEKSEQALNYLKDQDVIVMVVEQTPKSFPISELSSELRRLNQKGVAIVVGHEVDGVSDDWIKSAELCAEIPMYGVGKSLNVAVAAGIVAYQVTTALRQL